MYEPANTMTAQAALFFRTYQAANLPLYAAMVADLCASPRLPYELPTVLEDIGQAFMRLADEVNDELLRRGMLQDEAEVEQSVEVGIDRMLERLSSAAGQLGLGSAAEEGRILGDEQFQRALRVALLMTHGLPATPAFGRRNGSLAVSD